MNLFTVGHSEKRQTAVIKAGDPSSKMQTRKPQSIGDIWDRVGDLTKMTLDSCTGMGVRSENKLKIIMPQVSIEIATQYITVTQRICRMNKHKEKHRHDRNLLLKALGRLLHHDWSCVARPSPLKP